MLHPRDSRPQTAVHSQQHVDPQRCVRGPWERWVQAAPALSPGCEDVVSELAAEVVTQGDDGGGDAQLSSWPLEPFPQHC